MSIYEQALEMHRQNTGKIRVESKVEVNNQQDLGLAYSPGVAEPCRRIQENPDDSYVYTARGNLVAVVSTGTAVLGLGDIGGRAALPVMEGKAVLFKKFAGIDAFPLCIESKEVDQVVEFVRNLEPTFAGINLEDIAAPACFAIEERLKQETGMAIFHDDQHGTAIVVLAGVINALKLVDKQLENIKIVISGAGASATAVAKLLLRAGAGNIIVCDSRGSLYQGRKQHMNQAKRELACLTNPDREQGGLEKVIRGADLFIGLSIGGLMDGDMVKTMADNPLVFPLANPEPEIQPKEAHEAGARVVATGRSDYPNQINNVLAFPGVMRGALDVRARDINEEMKLAAARGIARLVAGELSGEKIIPAPFDKRVAPEVAGSVARAAMESGVARLDRSLSDIKERASRLSQI